MTATVQTELALVYSPRALKEGPEEIVHQKEHILGDREDRGRGVRQGEVKSRSGVEKEKKREGGQRERNREGEEGCDGERRAEEEGGLGTGREGGREGGARTGGGREGG